MRDSICIYCSPEDQAQPVGNQEGGQVVSKLIVG